VRKAWLSWEIGFGREGEELVEPVVGVLDISDC